jgi:hypothetical protein
MRFITENNGTVDFKGFDKMQGLLALSDSTGNRACCWVGRRGLRRLTGLSV